MKTKFTVIFLSAFLLGAFVLFGAVSAVHAEDVTPTPEVTPTEEITLAPTEPVPSETPTPEPTASPMPTEPATPIPTEPEPTVSIIPIEEPGMMSLMGEPSPMFASLSDSVWFMYNGSRQNFFTISEAIDKLVTEYWVLQDGILHIDSSYGKDTVEPYYDTDDKPLTFYPEMSGI